MTQGCRYRELLQVVLSRAARSARLTTHYELDFPRKPQAEPYYCYKHRRISQPRQEALRFLLWYSGDTFERVEQFSRIRSKAAVQVLCGDARKIVFPSADMVLTSPVSLLNVGSIVTPTSYSIYQCVQRMKSVGILGTITSGNSALPREHDLGIRYVMRCLRPGGRMIIVVQDRFHFYEEIARRLGCRVELPT